MIQVEITIQFRSSQSHALFQMELISLHVVLILEPFLYPSALIITNKHFCIIKIIIGSCCASLDQDGSTWIPFFEVLNKTISRRTSSFSFLYRKTDWKFFRNFHCRWKSRKLSACQTTKFHNGANFLLLFKKTSQPINNSINAHKRWMNVLPHQIHQRNQIKHFDEISSHLFYLIRVNQQSIILYTLFPRGCKKTLYKHSLYIGIFPNIFLFH